MSDSAKAILTLWSDRVRSKGGPWPGAEVDLLRRTDLYIGREPWVEPVDPKIAETEHQDSIRITKAIEDNAFHTSKREMEIEQDGFNRRDRFEDSGPY